MKIFQKNESLKNKRKRKNVETVYNAEESLNQVEAFLNLEKDKTKDFPKSSQSCIKSVFDTVSDVSSSEDSDIEIISVTEGGPTSVNSACSKQTSIKKSLYYLTKPPICIIKPSLKNYLNFDDDDDFKDRSESAASDNTVEDDDTEDGHAILGNNASAALIIGLAEKEKEGKRRRRKSQKRFPNNPELKSEPRMFKYWSQRYDLFDRFDMGIKLDRESWFSVTPEYIAKEHSELCDESDTVLDGFCGAGGNTIQFANRCKKVYAVDIDQIKVNLTKHNCHVYGVPNEKVTVMRDDFHFFCSLYNNSNTVKDVDVVALPNIQVVFLSPPWGGQDYLLQSDNHHYSNIFDLGSIEFDKMMNSSRILNPRMIIVYLPRNTDVDRLQAFVSANETLTILKHSAHYKSNCGSKKVKAITAVFRSTLCK